MLKLFQSAPALTVPADKLTIEAPPERAGMDVLAHGTLRRSAEECHDRNGKGYTRAVLDVERQGLPTMHIRLLSHIPHVSLTLQAMEAGDPVTVAGDLLLTEPSILGINVRRLLSQTPTVSFKQRNKAA